MPAVHWAGMNGSDKDLSHSPYFKTMTSLQ